MWFQKNKWKIIGVIVVVAVLAAAFYFGGNAPGSRGWEISGNEPAVNSAPNDVSAQTPQPEITLDAEPTPVPATEPPQNNEPEETESPIPTPEPPLEPTPEPESTPVPTPTSAPTPEPTPVPTPEPTPQPTMEIDPDTGKDKYYTDPVPEGMPPPVEPQDVTVGTTAYSCTISISCATILNNMDYCDPAKMDLVPADGWILYPITVVFYEGESVFNVLQRTCKQQGIHMEFENTPIYNSAYIEGIGNLYEFDVGNLSGWMYKVNGWFPNYGCSRYQLRDGDVICWVYTCDLGNDVGGGYAVGNS